MAKVSQFDKPLSILIVVVVVAALSATPFIQCHTFERSNEISEIGIEKRFDNTYRKTYYMESRLKPKPKSFPMTAQAPENNLKPTMFSKPQPKKMDNNLFLKTYYMESRPKPRPPKKLKIMETISVIQEQQTISTKQSFLRLLFRPSNHPGITTTSTNRTTSSKIEQILHSLNYNPNMGVTQLNSNQINGSIFGSGRIKKIHQCYSDWIGRRQLDLFKSSLKQIIHTEFKIDFVKIFRLIKNLLEGIKEIVMLIIECLKSPPEYRSQFGLTSMSAMSSAEFKQTFNADLMRKEKLDVDVEDDDDDKDEDDKGPEPVDEDNHRHLVSTPVNNSASYLIGELDPEPEPEPESILQSTLLNQTSIISSLRQRRIRRRINSICDHNCSRKFYNFSKKTKTDNRHCNFHGHRKVPDRFDWRDQGVVTPVKNQGHCGSCYIFSAIGALESAMLIKIRQSAEGGNQRKINERLNLSEQSILNCLPTRTCKGGHTYKVFHYMKTVGAIKQRYLKYRAKVRRCRSMRNARRYRIRSYCYFRYGVSDRQLQTLVHKYGPSMVAIDCRGIKHLKGRYNGKACSGKVNHAVLLVGWTKKYWIIKNSWSQHWGVDGYLYLRRDRALCGINSEIGAIVL